MVSTYYEGNQPVMYYEFKQTDTLATQSHLTEILNVKLEHNLKCFAFCDTYSPL